MAQQLVCRHGKIYCEELKLKGLPKGLVTFLQIKKVGGFFHGPLTYTFISMGALKTFWQAFVQCLVINMATIRMLAGKRI